MSCAPLDTFGEYEWQVRSYECGPDGVATLPAVCNYLQESASLNAESLKFSKSDFNAAGENITWVLTRMRVEMRRYPRWEEKFSVLTFPRGGRRIVAWRDFEIRAASGETLGAASSEWMIIDLASRKIQTIPPRVFGCANTAREPVLGNDPFTARLKFPAAPTPSADAQTFRAAHSHIDMNGHVNNVHYVEWMLEPLLDKTAAGALAPAKCASMEIVFRSETLAGENVVSDIAAGAAPGEFFHQVSSADGKPHITARTVWQ